MSAITISIKLLAGDVVSLDVAPRLSFTDLYVAVFHALPESVRPETIYALQLFRDKEQDQEEEEEEEEAHPVPYTEELMELEDGEFISVFITPAQFRVELSLLTEDVVDIEEDVYYDYSRYTLTVYYDTLIISTKQFYITPFCHQEVAEREGRFYMRLIGPGAEISPYFHAEEGEFFRGTSDPALERITNRYELVSEMASTTIMDNLYRALDDAWATETAVRVEQALRQEEQEQEQEQEQEEFDEDPADWLDNDVIPFE